MSCSRVLAALFISFIIVPSASAELAVSHSDINEGTLNFSGSMHVLDCTRGDANLRVLLKRPGGGYEDTHAVVRKKETLHGGGDYIHSSLSFDFYGTLLVNSSWPKGEYELVADGYYYCNYFYGQPVSWIGDKKESMKFIVSGDGPSGEWGFSTTSESGWLEPWFSDTNWEPGRPPFFSSGYYRSAFTVGAVSQTDLSVSAHQSADCWVNGWEIMSGISSKKADITPYIQPGKNAVACKVDAGYEKSCDLWHGKDCGCSCWGRRTECIASTYFWNCPSNVEKGSSTFHVVAQPHFDATVIQYRPEEISWSNDRSTWYRNTLPIADGTVFLDRPDYYFSDSVYEGPRPWSGREAYFGKWLQSAGGVGMLAVSSVVEPECLVNNEPAIFEMVEDGWWVFQANVTLVEGQNRVLCSVKRNNDFNLFDVALLPLLPRSAVATAQPFEYKEGSVLTKLSLGGIPLPPIPAAPIGAAAFTALGAAGVSSYLARRRFPKGKGFWEKVGIMKKRFLKRKHRREEFNRKWKEHLKVVKNYEIPERGSSSYTIQFPGRMWAPLVFAPILATKSKLNFFQDMFKTPSNNFSYGSARTEEIIWSDWYTGIEGRKRFVRENTVFVGEKELNTTLGIIGSEMSFQGYMHREDGEVTFGIGCGLVAAGNIIKEVAPVAAGFLGEIGGIFVVVGGLEFTGGNLVKSIGDVIQSNICSQIEDNTCSEKPEDNMEFKIVDACMGSLSSKTKLGSIIGAGRIGVAITETVSPGKNQTVFSDNVYKRMYSFIKSKAKKISMKKDGILGLFS